MIKDYLKNKNVCIVGPAESINNTNKGDYIDGFDVVVRINYAKIDNPKEVESRLLQIPGVVQVGLFVNMCDDIVLATKNGIEFLSK